MLLPCHRCLHCECHGKGKRDSSKEASDDGESVLLATAAKDQVVLHRVDVGSALADTQQVPRGEAEVLKDAERLRVVAVDHVHQVDCLQGEDQLDPDHLVHESTGCEDNKRYY